MRLSPGNAQHIGGREQQEDSFGFSDFNNNAFVAHGGVVAVLADGMGGMAHGNAASQTAVQTFLAAYAAKSPRESIPQALDRALKQANIAVGSKARDAGLEDGMGTTLVAAVIHNGSLYWISAGDSRVYLLRSGQAAKLTAEHVYANELREEVAQGKLSRAEALSNAQRADLTSYLGLDVLPEIDRNLKPFFIRPGESVILCSDGLYRGLKDDEIATYFQGDTQSACEALVERVLAKRLPHQDNVTVVALRYDDGAPKSETRTRIAVVVSAFFLTAALGFAGFWWWNFLRRGPKGGPAQGPQTQQALTTENTTATPVTPQRNPAPHPERGESARSTASEGARDRSPQTSRRSNASTASGAETNKLSEKGVSLTPATIEFPPQPLRTSSKVQQIILKNGTRESLDVLHFELTGRDVGDFDRKGSFCGTVQAGKSCVFDIAFVPVAAGRRDAKFTVKDNLGRVYEAELTGTGVAPPSSASAPNKQETPSATTKTSHESAQGGQPAQGQQRASSSSASGGALKDESPPIAKTGQAPVQPSGPAGGQQTTAAAHIPAEAQPSQAAGKSSEAVAAPAVSLSNNALDFKKCGVGKISEPQMVELTNNGDAAVNIVSITLDDEKNFKKDDTCRTPLKKGASCTVKVFFTPQEGEKKGATLTITDGSGHTQRVSLSGTGTQSFLKRVVGE